MPYVQIGFPLNLSLLTYACPADLSSRVEPGMVVSAPLRNRQARGLVFSKDAEAPDGQAGKIREITALSGDLPLVGTALVRLFRWMAEYYLSSEGLVLKQTLPHEIFSAQETKRRKSRDPGPGVLDLPEIPEGELSVVRSSLAASTYRTFLFRAPAKIYEYAAVSDLLRFAGQVVVLLPEVMQADLLYASLRERFDGRICRYHGQLSKGERSEAFADIVAGRRDVVIGTRQALFMPFRKLSLIIVLHEHNTAYKNEEAVRYHTRDVAVMRGFLEGCTVLLSSVSPSVESSFNVIRKKFTLLHPNLPSPRPRIRVADMRFEKQVRPLLSRTVYERARRQIMNDKRVMFLVNRRGYSPLLQCAECGHVERCPNCGIPFVLHKQRTLLLCHSCGASRGISATCTRCRSHRIETVGAGTERVQQDIEELFKIGTARLDSDTAGRRRDSENILRNVSGDDVRLIVGTKLMARRVSGAGAFALAAVLTIDTALNLPDFRAFEKAYAEISSVAELVEEGGEVIIQTRFPRSHLFRALRSNQYDMFVENELAERKTLGYPPFARLLEISTAGGGDLAAKIEGMISRTGHDAEILGPTVRKSKKGRDEVVLMLRAPDRKTLLATAKVLLLELQKIGGIRPRVDVDPVS